MLYLYYLNMIYLSTILTHYEIFRGHIMLKIKEKRKKKGYSQEAFAEILGISQNAVSQYETGKREPDIETLSKISIVLDITVEELIEFRRIYDKVHDELYAKIVAKEKQPKS